MNPYQNVLADRGWLDSASLYQVIDFFDQIDRLPAGYSWSFQSVIEVTALLLYSDHQSIAASSQRITPQDDIQSRLHQSLVHAGAITSRSPSSQQATKNAKQDLAELLSKPVVTDSLRDTLLTFQSDVSFKQWSDWAVSSGAVVTHRGTHGSIVDHDTSNIIAQALGLGPSDLSTLLKAAADPKEVGLLSDGDNSPIRRQLLLAYAGSALIRGLFHRLLAEHSNEQLTPHPMRDRLLREVLPSTESSPTVAISNTSEALARLIIAIALRQSTTADRLARWVENIRRARAKIADSWGYLVETQLPTSTTRAVEDFARRASLVFARKELVQIIDWTIGYSLNRFIAVRVDAVLSPLLGSEPGIVVGASLGAVANAGTVSERIANRLSFAMSDDIKKCGRGVVRRIWTNGGMQQGEA